MRIPRNPGIYCRLSYAPDGSLEKVERQEADCRQLLDRLGWPQPPRDRVYSDNSKSAWQRNRKRPEWDRMLRDIETGVLDGVCVYHGDRLVRQPWDLELLLKLADDKQLPLASVSGTRDLSNPDDQFILRIEAAQACRESANTSRRVRRAYRARADRGLGGAGGRRPFGYGVPTGRTGRTGRPVYDTTKVVEHEAAILREVVQRLLAGETQGSVVRWMNRIGSRTTEGHGWTARSLRQILIKPRIAGMIRVDGQLREAAWPGIITPEQWHDLQSVIAMIRKRNPYPGRDRKYLLSGIAECYKCGSLMRTKPSGGRNRKTSRLYYCPERHIGRNVDHLDAYVRGRVIRLLNDDRLIAQLDVAQTDPGIGQEIAALERRRAEALQQLESLVDHPDISPELVARSLDSFNRRIAELRERIEAATEQRLLRRMVGITQEAFEAEPIEVQSATVKMLYRVIVLPATWRGPGFDPKSVRMIRRTRG